MAAQFTPPASFAVDDLFSVTGRTVVITGGGTGLGKAIANAYVTNGAKVFISGRRTEVLDAAVQLIKPQAGKGGDIVAVPGDVSTKAGCKKLYDDIAKLTDVVDVLVNCAGVMKSYRNPTSDVDNIDAVAKMLWEGCDDDDFNYTNQININGVYFTTVAFIPLLMKSDLKSVVVIASIAGHILQRAVGSVSYGASKAGTMHTANLLAGRLSPGKIRVNTICPGIFPSEMTGVSAAEGGHKYDIGKGAQMAAARSVVGRPGMPHEIVGPVMLLGSRAGSYMDGATLVIDGGRALAAGMNEGVRIKEELIIN
ncbi:hypothetical protein CspHIS471_0301510 [Cutaneotrichosporon sp. HIS471]|nr:hypothetical protein CspHIS471_0301510 [Cutaneotrichosporon sp. HIS471]